MTPGDIIILPTSQVFNDYSTEKSLSPVINVDGVRSRSESVSTS